MNIGEKIRDRIIENEKEREMKDEKMKVLWSNLNSSNSKTHV